MKILPNNSLLYSTPVRAVSLAGAALVVLIVVLAPRLVGEQSSDINFGGFVLMMFAMSACWVHGLGFVPENRFLRVFFSPLVAWPLMGFAAFVVFFARGMA